MVTIIVIVVVEVTTQVTTAALEHDNQDKMVTN
jgi:hypothetical protein